MKSYFQPKQAVRKGGPGSGNFGHGGRPGEVGGSSSEGGDAGMSGLQKIKPTPVESGKESFGGRHAVEIESQLSVDELKAFRAYSEDAGFAINGSLVHDKQLTKEQRLVAQRLSKVIRDKGRLSGPVTVYRGLSWKRRQDTDDFVGQFTQGKTIALKGFISTSVDQGFVEAEFMKRRGGGVLLEIKATHGVFMTGRMTEHEGQHEILLNHNSKFRIEGISKLKNMHVIQLTQIK